MNLTSKVVIKNLLRKYGFWPTKRLGQNFLIDKGVIKKIIAASTLTQEDTVLEIGPGIGNLTQELAKRAKKVIAVEKDPKMVEILRETLRDFKNIEVIQEDILKFRVTNCKLQDYKIVGNLPFYLTAPCIRQFLECNASRPRFMVLVVQKEVAQRICAKPPRMNLLAVSVQFYAGPEIISYISKKSFWPQPEVDAAIIKITPTRSRTILDSLFFRIVKAGFSQPRKQLINTLSRGLKIDKKKVRDWLLKNGVQPTQRAETLTVKDWVNLTKSFAVPR